MRNFRIIIIAILSIIVAYPSGNSLLAQDCSDYFPMKQGTVLKYVNYDHKDRVTGGNEMSFSEKKDTPEGMSVLFDTKIMDDKGEVIYGGDFRMECKNGVIHMDASQLLDAATMSAYESMEVEVTGEFMELPLGAADGTELADGGVKAVVSSNGMKIMTMTVDVQNRRIAAHETIETPAGSFECTKYTYDAHSKFGFVKMDISSIEWYSPKYGTVRSESYDKKGKLTGYSLLESVSD
jgi:hypothetical protein